MIDFNFSTPIPTASPRQKAQSTAASQQQCCTERSAACHGFTTHMSWVEKVKQLPMSYDCLTHMLTHPLRRYMFANCILAFAGIGVIQIPFASFRGRSFETNVLVHCSPPSVSSDTKACPGGIVGWAYAGLTLTLRGPYADFTSTCWKFLHEI